MTVPRQVHSTNTDYVNDIESTINSLRSASIIRNRQFRILENNCAHYIESIRVLEHKLKRRTQEVRALEETVTVLQQKLDTKQSSDIELEHYKQHVQEHAAKIYPHIQSLELNVLKLEGEYRAQHQELAALRASMIHCERCGGTWVEDGNSTRCPCNAQTDTPVLNSLQHILDHLGIP